MPAPFLNIGDKVFLHTEFIHTTRPLWKLADMYLSPFEIIGVAGPASFVLQLPDGMRHVQCGMFHSWNLPMMPILKDTCNHPHHC